MKLQEMADQLGAQLVGAGDTEIRGVAGIEEAVAGYVTFVANPKYASAARTTRASAVIVAPDFPAITTATLRVANPYLAFARAIDFFYQSPAYLEGIHPTAVIDPSAKINPGAHIGAYVVIGAGVVIGADAVILPHVVIYPDVRIGNRFFAHAHSIVREGCRLGNDVVLQNGAIIGADGFGFAKTEAGAWQKITQSGPAVLGNAVEVQANACIDRASVGRTEVRDGAKIDNLVQVGHGSSVGENTLLCSQVGLAGSSEIGRNVILAGQVGVAGHLAIGDGAIATAQSGVHHDVAPGKVVSGTPAFDNRQWLKAAAIYNKLPDLLKQLQRKPKNAADEANG